MCMLCISTYFRYQNYSKETHIRFHLHKAARNVQSLLEKLFVNEIKDDLDQLEFDPPIENLPTRSEKSAKDESKVNTTSSTETYLHDTSSIFMG